jgi:Pyruvate/2-oxoacid:ferredoxin oxidoreductase delta subunit
MKRSIITINAEACTGCGVCIPNCPEGAIQIIDNKARLVGDLFCDGLGACLGHCPEGAIRIEEREAQDYNEYEVMNNIVKQGPNVIKAHLKHLRDHKQSKYAAQAEAYLKENNLPVPSDDEQVHSKSSGCPGTQARSFVKSDDRQGIAAAGPVLSELRQWPVQLRLVSPMADYFRGSDVVLAADCVAFALGDFHAAWLRGKSLAIACPKLDNDQELYREKITLLIDDAGITSLTVMIMEVPCCGGLVRIAQEARARASRKIPLNVVVVGIEGAIVREERV